MIVEFDVEAVGADVGGVAHERFEASVSGIDLAGQAAGVDGLVRVALRYSRYCLRSRVCSASSGWGAAR